MIPVVLLSSVVVLVAAWLTGGGVAGWLYLLIYAMAAVPGLPIGWLLFGRRHAAGSISGALLGYALTCLCAWLVQRTGAGFTWALIATWAICAASSFALCRRPLRRGPLVDLGAWSTRDTAALAVLFAITATIAAVPLRRVGEIDSDGSLRYRAYFTADFLWHTALTAELTAGSMPPRNPYIAPEPIHYYWTYFLVPAAVARSAPPPLGNVQTCLKLNAFATGLLFMSAVFMAAHAVTRQAAAAAGASILVLLASSGEGLYELWRLWTRGAPLSALRGINVDALTSWYFQGHRIDGLQRCLWYVPQHSMAYALGLVAITAGAAAGAAASPLTLLIVGCALGASVIMNPFVGGLFALGWGIACALNALGDRAPLRRIALHLIAVVPVAAGIAWCVSNRMVEGAGGTLVVGWGGASRHHPIWNLLLSLGPALAPALLLVWFRPAPSVRRALLPAVCLAAIALFVMYVVRLNVDEAWVPFRAGQMLLAVVPALTAAAWQARGATPLLRGAAAMAVGLSMVAGLPTTLIDGYNAQDVSETREGAGFHWTLVVSREEQQALDWIRLSTPRGAIVQMEPTLRDRDLSPGGWGEHWTLIPSLAERRMAAGMPISLLRVPAYETRSLDVKEAYTTANVEHALGILHRLRINYLYVDGKDRAAYLGTAKFDANPVMFEPAFRVGSVAVYRVR
ncbi:MAG: hypothetical protein ABIS06_03320 [Vicinamibacterales bacterium]